MTEKPKPRVLIVTRNLPPLVGGMERLNWHMAAALAKFAEVRVIGPGGSAAMAPHGVAVHEIPLKPLWRFLWLANFSAWREARRFRPQVVLAGSGLTAPIVMLAGLLTNASTVAYVHGLDLTTRHLMYRCIWISTLRRMHRVVANSNATAAIAAQIGIDQARIGIVHPGVALPDAEPRVHEAEIFRKENNLGKSTLLLSVGRLSERKGLVEFVREALPRIVAERPDVVLLIVGGVPKDALNSRAQTPKHIQAAADELGLGEHIRFMGNVSDRELQVIFAVCDVHVFPIRHIPDDPEGFGMVAIEAAAHGVPTVAFATGGVIDAVAEGQSGHLVHPGDYSAFADAVLKIAIRKEITPHSCRNFASQFEWSQFGVRIFSEVFQTGDAACRLGGGGHGPC